MDATFNYYFQALKDVPRQAYYITTKVSSNSVVCFHVIKALNGSMYVVGQNKISVKIIST